MSVQFKNGVHGDFKKCEDNLAEVNENFKCLDFLKGPAVLGTVSALPPTGATGDAYILSPSGDVWVFDTTWQNTGANIGQTVYDPATGEYLVFDGTAWIPLNEPEPMDYQTKVLSSNIRYPGSAIGPIQITDLQFDNLIVGEDYLLEFRVQYASQGLNEISDFYSMFAVNALPTDPIPSTQIPSWIGDLDINPSSSDDNFGITLSMTSIFKAVSTSVVFYINAGSNVTAASDMYILGANGYSQTRATLMHLPGAEPVTTF